MENSNKRSEFASEEELKSWYEKKRFGASFNKIIDEECQKLGITADEFLTSNETLERRKELGKIFEILLEPMKDKSPGTVNAGSFGLGKRKS